MIADIIKSIDDTATEEANTTPATFVIANAKLLPVCDALWRHASTYFDQLTCITGVDNGPEANSIDVLYHLYSIPFHHAVALKVVLPRNAAQIDSVTSIWKGANWFEREVFDMFGVRFNNHPDLRRILMPGDWDGYPLRKDYQHQETYRDIQVKY